MAGDLDDWIAGHRAALRNANTIAMNILTGNVEENVQLVTGMSTHERNAAIAVLAADLAVALRELHGGRDQAVAHLRANALDFAEVPVSEAPAEAPAAEPTRRRHLHAVPDPERTPR